MRSIQREMDGGDQGDAGSWRILTLEAVRV